MLHKSVLLQEAIQYLHLQEGMTVVDGTLGSGGHSAEIVKRIGRQGKLIAIDQDPAAVERSRSVLKEFPQVFFYQENFRNLDNLLNNLNIHYVNAVILDVGFSSDQLEDAERGFSFEREGPLDMRMNPANRFTARDFIHDLSQEELEKVFRDFGEERWARRFAKAICRQREIKPIETTGDLVAAIRSANPFFDRKRHPATRVFQALRIAVNDELGALSEGLPSIWKRIQPGGRLVVITFHSLEDRIVKNQFREWGQAQEAVVLTKKPVVPSLFEIEDNPRARSAKLRAVEKKA